MFDVLYKEGIDGLQVELIYSWFDSEKYNTARGLWASDIQDAINAFLDGKTVHRLDMDFAGEDKDRIYGVILYSEE